MRALKAFFLTVCVLIISIVLYWLSYEGFEYLTRSEIKARGAAEKLFEDICARDGFDPREFVGPNLTYSISNGLSTQYNFVWIRNPAETISIGVTYFPYDLPYSLSRGLIERRDMKTEVK
jgi:hypothetical protein